MKVIIAGSRNLVKLFHIEDAIKKSGFEITEVVSGCAVGADSLGEYWAAKNDIPVKKFPAPWDQYGKAAGAIRNVQMAEYADAAIVVWDGASKGSKHMIKVMHDRRKSCHVHVFVSDNFMDDSE
jgi:hypothetical protein